MNTSTVLLYTATWALVALTPGPAVMCSMAQASRFGFGAALAGIAGVQTGNFLFFGAVACGLAALLAAATTAFTILQWAGALYLIWLGLRHLGLLRKSVPAPIAKEGLLPARRSLFAQGVLVQITNPKALLFVSALLPQFIDPARPAPPQLAVLLAITIAVDAVVLSGYAALAERGARRVAGTRMARWLERAFGAALVFFGARLLFSRR